MVTEVKRNAINYYAAKAFSSKGLGKIIRDPAVLVRTLRTLTTNRNFRKVPTDELLRDAEDSVHALARLAGPAASDWETKPSADVDALCKMFLEHGSDKSTHHDYHEVYGPLVDRKANLRILEVGLGTNNLSVQSNMGLGGHPGASLRAFRDWAPKAQVFGADIDAGILFEEDRIKTYWVDQTDPASLRALAEQVGTGFDLIIDDGLHLPHANFNTIEALRPLLKPTGTMVIEDIDAIHLHYWHAVTPILGGGTLLSRRGGYLFILGAS